MSRSRGGTWLTTRSPIRKTPSEMSSSPATIRRGRFPASGRPDEHHELAVFDLEVDVVDGLCAVRIDLAHIFEGDAGHFSSLGESPRVLYLLAAGLKRAAESSL